MIFQAQDIPPPESASESDSMFQLLLEDNPP